MNSTTRIHLLLMEDDGIQALTIEESLKACLPNCTYHIATDGKSGLRALATEPFPNVVICDINMPVMSGWEVLKAIRARKELDVLPVVMFSSDSSAGTMFKAKELRATALIAKPVGLASVEQTSSASVEIVKLYAIPDSMVPRITKPLLQETIPLDGPKLSIDEMLDDL